MDDIIKYLENKFRFTFSEMKIIVEYIFCIQKKEKNLDEFYNQIKQYKNKKECLDYIFDYRYPKICKYHKDAKNQLDKLNLKNITFPKILNPICIKIKTNNSKEYINKNIDKIIQFLQFLNDYEI